MDDKDHLLIERYLHGDTTAEENAAVERRAAADPEFAKALGERRQLNEHLRAVAHEQALLATLQRLGDRYFPAEQTAAPEREAVVRPLGNDRRLVYGLLAAAVIALALFFAGPWFSAPGGGYEQFARHQPLSLTERGDGQQTAAAAETAYNDGNYPLAAQLLRAYLAEQSDDQRAHLALGVSLLETDRDEAAVEIFREIAESKTALAPYGNWYLALVAVKQGDEKAALRYLDLIPATDALLTKKAKELRATL